MARIDPSPAFWQRTSSMYRTSYAVPVFAAFAAALFASGCAPSETLVRPTTLVECSQDLATPTTLRVMSYNMHGGMSSSLDEIAGVIRKLDPDVVALQEVDRGVARSGGVDEDAVLAQKLGYQNTFAAARKRGSGDFGVAVLSRLPFARVDRIDLDEPGASQPRVALDTTVCVGSKQVRVVAVHTDVFPWASQAAVSDLLKAIDGSIGDGVIVAGDLNVVPTSGGPKELESAGLVDLVGRLGEAITFRELGQRRIDYIFADAPLAARAGDAGVYQTNASDHYPIYSDFSLEDVVARATW